MLALPWVFLAASSGSLDAGSLRTLALASQRPEACRAAQVGEDGALWAEARSGSRREACLRLARGYARLDSAPAEALDLARNAPARGRDDVELGVLEGRAWLRLGDFGKAYALLSPNVRARGRPLGDLAALRELGVTAAGTGHLEEAATAYRALLPRAAFDERPRFSRWVVLEAGSVLLASGASGLPDAILFLSEARRRAQVPGTEDLLLSLLALALERAGQAEPARTLLQESPGPWALERHLTPRDRYRLLRAGGGTPTSALPALAFTADAPQLAEGELHAAIGVAALRRDPRLARVHLEAYLLAAGPSGPFVAWAQERLAALKRGGT